MPATQPPSSGHGWRWPLRPARCRRAASSRAAVARSVPERPERAFKSAIQIPISESDCLGAALVYVRVQSPSTSCLHEATQRNTVSFSDLRKPSLSFGPAAAAGQSGGTSESREARANPKSRIRGSVGGTQGLAHVPAPVMLALRSGGLAGPHNVMWASRICAYTVLLSQGHGHGPCKGV